MPWWCQIAVIFLSLLSVSVLISSSTHNSLQTDTSTQTILWVTLVYMIPKPSLYGNPRMTWNINQLASFGKHLIMMTMVSFFKCFLCGSHCRWFGTSLITSSHWRDCCSVGETDQCTPPFFFSISWLEQEKVSLAVENTRALEARWLWV